MKLNTHIGNVDIHIDTKRIDKNKKEAQKLLNLQVAADCDPFIPFQQGALRNSVNYPEGVYGGELEWNAPYTHYQYMGEVYGPSYPRKDSDGNIIGWYSPPKKYPTGRPLHYHTEGTGDQWFSKAKNRHKNEWIKLVKDTVGKE